MKKLMMLVMVALVAASGWGEEAAFARATGASMRLDTREGVRLAAQGASETIAYSPRWGGDGHAGRVTVPGCTVTADGVTLKTASEEGDVSWTPTSVGAHTLAHTAGDVTYTAQFTVLGDDVAQHAGALSASETWGSDKVHLVTGDVTVPSGKTLTIEPGAVVKFMTGTSLTVNGTCVAYGVIFTHVNDDTAGGDTLMDGDATKPVMDGYKLTGNIYEDDTTEERYTAPQTLSSSISGTVRLKGHKVYLANSSITVNSGATLTILPGAIIKFASGCSMTVNGTLDAQGTRAAPIVFTSMKDDEWGGDTNGDGEKTEGEAGDWGRIYAGGTVNLNYCRIRHCNNTSDQGAIQGSGGTVTFDNGIIESSVYECVRMNSGRFVAHNSVFRDSSMGFGYYGGSGTYAYNCVIADCSSGCRASNKHFYNTVFYRCKDAFLESTASSCEHCVFYNPPGYGPQSATQVGSSGNIWGDPKFVDPDNGDFRIAADSPCIDAGDGTVAPEFDYWGQPRMDAKGKAATGVPNEDGVCPDIGIYEFPGKATVPVADLAVLSVSVPATAVPGEEIALTYVVTNRGEADAVGMVRDRFQLKGADAALGGQTVAAGEAQQLYSLAVGAVVTLTARVKCPTVKTGNWSVGVTVNAERDIFEQVTANNTGWASEPTAVELEALATGESRVSVAAGTATGFVVGEGARVIRVTCDAALDQIAVYGANGAVPVSAEGGVAAVRLGDGSWLLVLPEAKTDEKGYVVIENGGASEVELKVTAEETKLAVCGVAPSRVAAVDGVSVTITGTGLAEDLTVTLGGRAATRVTKVNTAQIVATFDLNGMTAGAASVEVRGDGVPPSQGMVEIYRTTQGPKLEAKLVLPSSVRDGRIYTAWVEYANVGDEPMTMPVFKVERTDSSTKLGLGTATLTETKVFVGGIAPNHPAGVLQPGDSGRIPVFFMPSGTYGLKLTHTKETDNMEQFKAFGGVKPYLAAMSAAATRLNLRGRTAYNVHDFVDQAEAEKNGVPCAAVSGTVRNATTAEVLSGVAVALVSTNGLGVVETVTDENGYFQLSGLADGIYHFNLSGEYELDSASVGFVEISDQADRNDIGVLVRVGGCVRGNVSVNDGVPVEGARVFIEGDSGKIEEVKTDVSGGYAFTRLIDGAYKVGVCGTEGYAGEMKTNVVVDAVNRSVTVDFCLVRGGVVRGEVTGIGADVTNGCVWAMTVSGDIISTTCDEKGGFEFPGLAANTYTFQYQSAQHVSDISTIDVLAGATCSVNLSAQPRPLFRTTQKIGFGSLETSFVFEDYNRSTNITSWAWDFDADGKVDSRDPSPTHTYTAVGTNTVILTFVEDGVTYSTTNVACAIVEEPIETVYTDNAVVLGVNAGSLAAVEMTSDGVLVLTGTPDRTLTVGDVVVGAIGDDGFARRVLAVKGDSARWELQTENAPIEDVFVSVGMAGRSVQRRQVRRQMAASKTSANVLKAASSESSGGSGKKRFYTEGGGSFDFNYDFDVSIDYALKRLNGKTYWRIVPILTFERTIKSEFQIGVGVHQKVSESAETPPVLCIMAGPIPVVTGHFEVEFYASWDVGGKFVGGSEDFVRDTFKYGYEYYEGQLNVVKDHLVDHDSPKSQWDVEGSANVEVGASFGFKLRALAVMSASIGPKLAFGIKATESLHSPSKVSIYGKLGVEAEANLIDLDFNLSPFDYKRGLTWFWGNTSDLVSYTGPTADFSMTPPSGEAPLHVDFSYTGAKEKIQFLWWEKEYTPWKLSWKGTNWDGDPDGKLTESEGDYNSEAKWPVKLSVRGHVMNVLWPKTKTKYVIVGDPEETPDDGDDVTDDTGGGTPAKSCDPNEMAGPLGVGDPETERFVKPGEWMDYTIYFENKADADVPAQEVFVDAQLSEWLDWSTFEMGEVAFNNQNETVLAGAKNDLKTVAQNGADYKVQLSVTFDETTGAAHWYLRSYDPNRTEYNNWPAAVDAGFLPPNDETHRGEGHITYRVKVREDAPVGVRIDAAATIVFDQNEPIPTDPAWWNTVGSPIPETSVGDYVKYDLEADLGVVIGPYSSKEKVSVKGLPSGLKLVATKQTKKVKGKTTVTDVVYTIEGVATAARDYSTRPAYAVVTSGGKTTWQPIALSTVAQEVTELEPLALGASVKTNACEWLPGVASGWSVSGLPTGLKYTAKAVYSGTGKKKTLKYPAYTVYGKTTKAGLFTITAKKKKGSCYETLKYRVMVEPKAVDETVFPGLADVVATAYESYSNAVPVKVDKVSGLPAGLAFAAKNVYAYKNAKKKTGKYVKQTAQTIVGKPTKAGTYVVTYTKNVKSGKKTVAKTAQVVWTVLPNPIRPETTFNVSGGVVLNRNAGSSYATSSAAAMTFTATPGAAVTASGLPKGLSLKQVADGVWAIAGTPTATGTYYVTVTAKLNGNAVTQSVAVKVNAHPLAGSYSGEVRLPDYTYGGTAKLTVGSTGKVSLSLVEKGVKTSATLSKVTAVEESLDDPKVGKWKCVFTLKANMKGKKELLPKRTLTLVFDRKAGDWELPTCRTDSYKTTAGVTFGDLELHRTLSKTEISARVAAGRIPALPSVETVAILAGVSGNPCGEAVATGEVVVVSATYKPSTATYTVTGRLPDGKTFSASCPVLWLPDEPGYDGIGLSNVSVANGAGDRYLLHVYLPCGAVLPSLAPRWSYSMQEWGEGQWWEADEHYGLFGGDWTALPSTVSAALGTVPEEGLRFEFFWRAAELSGEFVHEERRFKVVSKKVKENKKTVTKYYASVSADGGASWVTSANPISWSAGRASFSVVLGGFTLTFDLALDKNGNLTGWARKSHTKKDAKGKKKTVVDAVGAAAVSNTPS